MINILCDAYGGNDSGLPFDYMRVTIAPEDVERINTLATAVAELRVYKIVVFDCRATPLRVHDPDDMMVDEEEDEIRTECDCMNVSTDGVFWTGYVKHTDDRWETSKVPFASLVDGAELDVRDDKSVAIPAQTGL